MALVKKAVGGLAIGSTPVVQKSTPSKLVLTIPKEKRIPSDRMADFSYLFYGAKGIGKSTLASEFPNAIFLSLEPSDRGMRVRSVDVPDWKHFVAYVDFLVQENDPTATTVVDVIDLAYEYIYDQVCAELKISSPRDMEDWGGTWRRISKAFRDQFQRLLRLPGGKVFLSHETEKEIELRDGAKADRMQPTMSKSALAQVEGLVDFIGNYCYEDETRYMVIRGHQTLVAKNRLKEHFVIKGGGFEHGRDHVRRIPMGDSPVEAFANFTSAFNNQQVYPDGSKPVIAAPVSVLKKPVGVKLGK